MRVGEEDIRAAAKRREIWDSGVLGEREADAREGPSSIGFEAVTSALSRVSESSCTDGIGGVLDVTMGDKSSGFLKCAPGCGESGVAGDNDGPVSGDCLGRGDWSVVRLLFRGDVSRDTNACSSPASEMLRGDLLLCEAWERPK
jgi:hypothetical protein